MSAAGAAARMFSLAAAKNALKNRENERWLWTVPVLLALCVNLNVLSNGLGLDDETIIPNLRFSAGWSDLFLPSPAGNSRRSTAVYFRPVSGLSYYLDRAIWGDRPFGFHFSVWSVHVLNTGLVFLLARRFMPGKGEPALLLPLLTASFFAVHPVHAEAVAWIAGRNDVFCATFLLIAALCYLRFLRTGGRPAYSFSMAGFGLALLTKEVAIGMIFLFPLLDYLLRRGGLGDIRRRMAVRFIGPVLILGGYLWFRSARMSFPSLQNAVAEASGSALASLAADFIGAMGFYLKIMMFPFPHQPFIDSIPGSPLFLLLSGLALVLVLSGIVYGLFRRQKIISFGLTWMMLFLMPALLIAVAGLASTPAAERYVYIPSIGFLMVFVHLALRGIGRLPAITLCPRAGIWIPAGLIIVLLIGIGGRESWSRNAVWRDSSTFWEAAVLSSPRVGTPYIGLGAQYAISGRYNEAEQVLQKAVTLDDKAGGPARISLGTGLLNLADLYTAQARYDEAEPLYIRSLEIWRETLGSDHRNAAITHHNLGGLYAAQGRYSKAEPHYRMAIGILEKRLGSRHTDVAKGLYNLGRAYAEEGRYEGAERVFIRALTIRNEAWGPLHPAVASSLLALADLYRDQGRYKEAEPIYLESLAVLDKTLGPASAQLAEGLSRYKELLLLMHREDEAKKIGGRAQEIREKRAGGRG